MGLSLTRAWLPRVLLPAVAGLVQAASIAAPWNGLPVWWLQLLSLAALVALLDRVRGVAGVPAPRRAGALMAWSFATAWLCAGTWWLFISMHVYGGLPAPLAAFATLLLAALLSLYYALAGALYAAWAPRSAWGAPALFAALWTLAELLRNSLFTGFPWAAGGYAHTDGPLSVLAPWVGVYGIGAAAAMLAVALAHFARHFGSADAAWRRPRNWWAPALLAVLLAGGTVQTQCRVSGCSDDPSRSTGRIELALLQGNIPQDEKFIPGGGVATALRWYGDELQKPSAPLLITPETAVPLLPSHLPPGYLQAVTERFGQQPGQAALVGLPLGQGRDYTNSVLGFTAGQAQPYRYDKHHLVPFGEFIPPMFRWFTDMMSIPLGDFRRGGLAQPAFEWQGQRIAPNICYEDLFGDEIGANFRDAARAPTILLNVSNIAWFGNTVAIDQHLGISRMRTLEFQRPMVRATNTGATAVIDHRGRVTHSLPRLTRGVLVAGVEGRSGVTPYAFWVSRMGLWPLWALGVLIVIAAGLFARRRT